MDNDVVVIVGPKSLIEGMATDPRLSGTVLDEATEDAGGLLAERKQSPLKALALAGTLLTTANQGITVAEHFQKWMHDSGNTVCEIVVRPKAGEQQLLRFRTDMSIQEMSELLEEIAQPSQRD